MTSVLTRRSILRGLFAAPVVVAASSLMPLRGLMMPVSSLFSNLPVYKYNRVTRSIDVLYGQLYLRSDRPIQLYLGSMGLAA